MKRIFSVILGLAFLIACCASGSAEAVIPAEVQAFYDMLSEKTVRYGAEAITAPIVYAENQEAYLEQEDMSLFFPMLSRIQYDSFYYWFAAEDLLVTIAYIGDTPAAYMLDGPIMNFIGAWEPYYEVTSAFADAYDELFPEAGANCYTEELLFLPGVKSTDENVGVVLMDQMECDGVLAAVYTMNSLDTFASRMQQDVFSLQYMPYAAYEGGKDGALANGSLTHQHMLESCMAILKDLMGSF